MASTNKLITHCNRCGGETNHISLKAIEEPWEQDIGTRHSIYGSSTHNLLRCAGCGEIKLRVTSWFSEETGADGDPIIKEIFYPPAISRQVPDWFRLLDNEWHITKLLNEVYVATQNGAKSLAAMGLRAVVEAVMLDKVGDHGSFARNLVEFEAQGFISRIQKASLLTALELGHASIHRSYEPSNDQLDIATDIVEGLVHQLYVLNHSAEVARRNIPKRKT